MIRCLGGTLILNEKSLSLNKKYDMTWLRIIEVSLYISLIVSWVEKKSFLENITQVQNNLIRLYIEKYCWNGKMMCDYPVINPTSVIELEISNQELYWTKCYCSWIGVFNQGEYLLLSFSSRMMLLVQLVKNSMYVKADKTWGWQKLFAVVFDVHIVYKQDKEILHKQLSTKTLDFELMFYIEGKFFSCSVIVNCWFIPECT